MRLLIILLTGVAWCSFSGRADGSIQGVPVINEIMSANLSSIQDEYDADMSNCPVPDCNWWYERMGKATWDGDYPDWVEIYNPGESPIDMTGYGLSDKPSHPYKWIFPQVVLKSKEYLVVFASGKDRRDPSKYLHTNFKIDRKGETLVLTDQNGVLCDKVHTGEIPIDFSLGRYPDGGDAWEIFVNPSPGKSNTGLAFLGFVDTVRFSHPSGYYNSGLQLTLSTTSQSAEIRYTLDGSNPKIDSKLYVSPIPLGTTTTVRVRAFRNGVQSSTISTKTYIIGERFTMPVVALSTDPGNLWNEDYGIYVPGRNADEGNRIANYWQDWERPCHVEFFEPDSRIGFGLDAGIKIYGWGSRANACKSLALFFRDKYGCDAVHYPIFPEFPITEFKSLVLRASGNDWQGTLFRDPFASSLVKNRDVDIQAFRPAIVFINGEYWGIHDIREKLNEEYLASHHGVKTDEVDIVSRYWRRSYPVIMSGDDRTYLELEDFLQNHDLSRPENYQTITNVIDINALLDYLVAQIYFADYDWPGNNNKCWRPRTPAGKWRWFLYDLDYTFNSNGVNDFRHNTLEHATTPNGSDWPNPPHTTFLFRKLLENGNFRNDLINRFADLMNTSFVADTLAEKLDRFQSMYAPEMQRHIERWGAFGLRSMDDWQRNVSIIREFIEKRQPYMKDHLSGKFGLRGTAKLSLAVSRAGEGVVKLNSILIQSTPWEGDYFLGVPIQLTALPNPGYRFSGWAGISASLSLSNPITIDMTETLSVTANFEKTDGSNADPVIDNEGIPQIFSVFQNYPDPFNASTTIAFSLPSRSFVSLKVFDALGRELSVLVSEELSAGTYTRQWNAEKFASGVYFYRLQAGQYIETKKLILLR